MNPELRRAWREIVTPQDYDAHMARVGQAQANALLLRELFEAAAPKKAGRVLFAGAGTGQMFDYVEADFLAGYEPVFSDLNIAFLARLAQRLRGSALAHYHLVADDIERSSLTGAFGAAALVLVLEHIDWRRGLSSIVALRPERVFLVLQQNPPDQASALTLGNEPLGTMRVFGERARPRLLVPGEVAEFLAAHGFVPAATRQRAVADGKIMLGLALGRP